VFPRSTGWAIVVVGVAIVVVGLLVASGSLSWLGHLPGDVRYESDRVRVYFPITSMILLSVVLSAIMYLFSRFL
jgi:hypothetical protein